MTRFRRPALPADPACYLPRIAFRQVTPMSRAGLKIALLAMLACGTAVVRAQADESPPSAADVEFFEQKIRPLLVTRCFECHSESGNGEKANGEKGKGVKGGLHLDSRAGILAGGDSGPAIVPEKPAESLVIEAINYSQDSAQMPPRGKLPQNEIDLLTEWVRRGAPFPNSETNPEGAGARGKKGIDFATGKKFWSFQPVHDHPLASVKTAGWGQRRIDNFILDGLERNGLAQSPAADRRTLLRRLSFDLVGLPPTPAELELFEADASTDAYVR